MVCAIRQNDVRSWQNGVRAIWDVTDVLGKMMCALVCALMCAPVAGVPVAQRISFSSTSNRRYTKYYSPCFGEVANNRRRRPSGTSPYVRPHVVRSLPFHVLSAMARDRGAKCFYLRTVLRCAVPRRRPQMAKWTMAR